MPINMHLRTEHYKEQLQSLVLWILSSNFPSCLPPLASPFLLHSFLSSQPHCTGYLRWFIRSSVQFSCSVMSDSLQPHGLQHDKPPCPSETPELAQTHVHQVGDAIQPSHPLLSPSPPAFNLSQHQGLFQWVSSSHQVAKVLESQLQHQSFQWIFRTDFLWDWLVWSSCSPRDS